MESTLFILRCELVCGGLDKRLVEQPAADAAKAGLGYGVTWQMYHFLLIVCAESSSCVCRCVWCI